MSTDTLTSSEYLLSLRKGASIDLLVDPTLSERSNQSAMLRSSRNSVAYEGRSWHGPWWARMSLGLLALFAAGCSDLTGPGGSSPGFVDSDGIQLHYQVDFPAGEGPFEAVVLGGGSGDVTIDNGDLARLAEQLLELGFATVRYDKRGTGESGGQLLNLGNNTLACTSGRAAVRQDRLDSEVGVRMHRPRSLKSQRGK